MTRYLLALLFSITFAVSLSAQPADSLQIDIIDVVIGHKKVKQADEIRSERKVHFSFFPAAVSAPGGGKVIITSINAAFYLGDPLKTNLSNIYIIPITDFASRYGVYVRPNLWLANNDWNLVGDYRVVHFPQYSWGLGGNSKQLAETLIESDLIRIYQNALMKVERNFFAGFGYALDYTYNIEESEFEEAGHLDKYILELKDPSVSSGVTFNLAYDSRQNPINPAKGNYVILTWRFNSKSFGSDNNYGTLYADGRKYIPFETGRVNILALRGYYWSVLKGDAPYLHLPATNWAPASGIASRGFQTGRYRSNAMMYYEAEHRYQLMRNGLFGMVAFMNVTSASEFQTQNFKYWHVGGGIGLRTKLNKFSNANLALDLGFSENYWSVWINIGEMF
jgi:hypothetical protein